MDIEKVEMRGVYSKLKEVVIHIEQFQKQVGGAWNLN